MQTMTRRVNEDRARRLAFGDALAMAMTNRGVTQQALAKTLGVSQPTISDWINGETEPKLPRLTFELEEVLGLRPGVLSRHLGYVPEEAVGDPVTFEALVEGDGLLTPDEAKGFVSMYRSIISGRRPKRRPR